MNGNEFWRSGLLDRRQLLKGAAATAAADAAIEDGLLGLLPL